MNKFSLAAVFAVIACFSLGVARAQDTFVTFATGAQEVPPVPTPAFSLARFQFSPGDTTFVGLRLNIGHDQDVTGVHIHRAPFGEDGNIILNMRPTSPGEGICIDLLGGLLTYYLITKAALREDLAGGELTALKDEMALGDTYINLHTPENPGGWIRGQMILEP